MNRYKKDGYRQYTYDPQSQVDKCLECEKSAAQCDVCSANPNVEHREIIDEKVIELWRQGLYDREIAEALGVSLSHVAHIRRKYDLPPKRYKSKTIDKEKFKKLWESGKSDGQIAIAFECSVETVRTIRNKLKLPAQSKRSKQ